MVRELFQMARSKKACVIFFDEVDAIGGARFDDGAGGDNEVQRTMLQIVTELDGFDARGNIKVLMATNRYDIVFSCNYTRVCMCVAGDFPKRGPHSTFERSLKVDVHSSFRRS
jgi:SpoVK/Ycf46/Vps4 family AAA+-type ATPase